MNIYLNFTAHVLMNIMRTHGLYVTRMRKILIDAVIQNYFSFAMFTV